MLEGGASGQITCGKAIKFVFVSKFETIQTQVKGGSSNEESRI
jgi:hypothetical protein